MESKSNEKIIEQCTCSICHQILKIPVRLTCFNTNNETHMCTEYNKICYKCAKIFLKLNSKLTEEDIVRCPFCNRDDTKIILKNYFGSYFVKDHSLMNFLTILAEKDIIPEVECDCGLNFKNQGLLEMHIDNDCPEASYKCECGRYVLRKKKDDHKSECYLNFNICPICCERFGKEQKNETIEHFKMCVRINKQVDRGLNQTVKYLEEQEEIFKEGLDKVRFQISKINSNLEVSRNKTHICEELIKKFEKK